MGAPSLALLPFALLAQIYGADPVARPPLPEGETAVDQVVATLEPENESNPRFVLQSEFAMLLRVELVIHHAPDPLHIRVDSTTWQPVLEQLMGEILVAREAERSGMRDADLAEDRARLRAWMVARLGGDDGLRALLDATGNAPSEFDALVRRRALAARYLVARQPRLIEPSDTDLRDAFEAGRFRALYAADATLATARDAIREELIRASLPQALRQYLRALGSRVRIRVFRP